MRRILLTIFVFFIASSVFSLPFNENLSETDLQKLNAGECVIRSIDYAKNMSLKKGINDTADELIESIDDLNPKYLGEVILVKPYKGNEDLPEKIEALLKNIDSYTDIPYWSEHAQKWFMMYDEAETVSYSKVGNKTVLMTNFIQEPLGFVEEQIEIVNNGNSFFYNAVNKNRLGFKEIKNLLGSEKMQISITVFFDGSNWIIYGAGGLNAPHIPFLTDRIRVSLINRICTFCDYIFKKL